MYFILTLLLTTFVQAKESSASFTVTGVIKPILLIKVTQITPVLYNAQVTSNNPQGFKISVDHDGIIKAEDGNISVTNQTKGEIFNFPIRFTTSPTFISVSIAAD
jgi:hypothetical protein